MDDSVDKPAKVFNITKESLELLKLGRFKLIKIVNSVPHTLDEFDNSFVFINREENKNGLSLRGWLSFLIRFGSQMGLQEEQTRCQPRNQASEK